MRENSVMSSVCAILPPHIIDAMAESDSDQVRKSALSTRAISERIRQQRRASGRGPSAEREAEAEIRAMYTASNQELPDDKLPGSLLWENEKRGEADAAALEAFDRV